jgi:hypothetical protein
VVELESVFFLEESSRKIKIKISQTKLVLVRKELLAARDNAAADLGTNSGPSG